MERRQTHRRVSTHERLTTRLLLRISLWSLVLVVIASVSIFVIVYDNAKQTFIHELKTGIDDKIARNERFFGSVERYGEALSEKFLQQYQLFMQDQASRNAAVAKFDAWYEETSPGVLRLQPRFHHQTIEQQRLFEYISAFVGPRKQALTNELKVRVIAAQYALQEMAPAWQHMLTNSHFSMPENILILYSPEHPWGLLADKDLVITDYSVVRSTLVANNPERKTNWTGLYYDISAGYWTITYQQPVDWGQQHLVNTSFDVGLNQLIDDLTARQRPDAEHMVLNHNGHLISASNIAFDLVEQQSLLTPETYRDPWFLKINEVITQQKLALPTTVFDELIDGHVVIFERINNPSWWYVTVYPIENIQREAAMLPVRLVVGGVALLLLLLVVIYILVRRQVTEPLTEIAKVASMMDASNYNDVVGKSSQKDFKGEVRLALNAFVTMARRFINEQEQLEQKVELRTQELERANTRLAELVNVDGLTGLLNRRSFDHDLHHALSDKSEPMVLALGDLDSFKRYNDNYGHECGDKALQDIATYLMKSCKECKVYRYGGEELAILAPKRLFDENQNMIDTLREGVLQLNITHAFSNANVDYLTISFGVAPVIPGTPAADTIRQADQQLYLAKRRGGNCTVYAEPSASE